MAESRLCSIPDCSKPHMARGWCRLHYTRWQKHGDPLAGGRDNPVSQCSVSGCGRLAQKRGWCNPHYNRWYRHGDPTGSDPRRGAPMRFIREVAKHHDGEECLIWPFSRLANGYGAINRGGRVHHASRIVCEETHGPPPSPAHHAAHSCGRGHEACVSGAHISWKTPIQNNADKIGHGTVSRGARNGHAKLSEQDVHEIRALRGTLKQSEIAKIFGVSSAYVSEIQTRRKWSWLD